MDSPVNGSASLHYSLADRRPSGDGIGRGGLLSRAIRGLRQRYRSTTPVFANCRIAFDCRRSPDHWARYVECEKPGLHLYRRTEKPGRGIHERSYLSRCDRATNGALGTRR